MKKIKITGNNIEDLLINLGQITLEVTDACNLKCKYCAYGDLYSGYDVRENKYLSFETVKTLIDYLSELWKSKISTSQIPKTHIGFYGGEPLMNIKLIKKTVEYIENLNIRRNFAFIMTTNAMLLDRYMNFLVEKKFNLLISLDGDSEGQSYRVNHSGRNSFDIVYRNVKLLQAKYPQYFEEHVEFNSVLHNRNSVERTFTFIKNEFAKKPTIAELNSFGIREDKIDEFYATYNNKAKSLYSSDNCDKLSDEMFVGVPQTKELFSFLKYYSGNVFVNYNYLLFDKSKLKYITTGTCSPFSRKLFLTVNGKIIQCERIHHSFALGNVENGKVNLDFEYVATRFNAYLDKLYKQCLTCFRKQYCNQCFYSIPGIDGEKPTCNSFMNKEDFEEYKMRCLNHLNKYPKLYKKLMTEAFTE
ncbi:MAG: radical SAM peptide maturase [Prevotellaceae bacterium]|jgi:uncharacterized protein|nr:radical SAM peptide maturase [Prevotellaceae bacterium]